MSLSPHENFRQELRACVAGESFLTERIAAEIHFAEGLCEMHPSKARAWRKLVEDARKCVPRPGSTLSCIRDALEKVESILAPLAKTAKEYTVHCVGHAHIDMNWMWSWPETVATVNDTFTTVLTLMEEFDDFHFTQSQASVYEIARRYNPELFEAIVRRIQEGRWEMAAVQWVEGDKNLAGGESLARHLLCTRRFAQEQMGLASQDATLDWEPDTFGHALTIPTILSRGGVKHYYFCRGGKFDKPPVFFWKGPDGSRVLACLETTWYLKHMETIVADALLHFCRKTNLKTWMCVYGIGDHGGGPTRRDLLMIREMNSWPVFPTFRCGTAGQFFELLDSRDDWPVLDCELNFEFTGCYTSQSAIKKANRVAENRCVEADAAAALALRATGMEYPSEPLHSAWIKTLFGHFHDILPGSGVRATREYHMGQFQEIAAETGMVLTRAYRSIAAAVDTRGLVTHDSLALPVNLCGASLGAGVGRETAGGGVSAAGFVAEVGRPVVIFNPLAQDRREVVRVHYWAGLHNENLHARDFLVRTADGKTYPAQQVGSGDFWQHKYVELAFPVEVPAMGYAAFGIEPCDETPRGTLGYSHKPFPPISRPEVSPRAKSPQWLVLENDHLLVEFDPLTGGIVKLLDKAAEIDFADPKNPMALLEYAVERPGGMTSWVIHPIMRREHPLEVSSLRMKDWGPYLYTVEAVMKAGESQMTVVYSLRAGEPWVGVNIRVNWNERGSSQDGIPQLAMRFPMALDAAAARYEIPFGSILRTQRSGEEVPALRWADVTGTSGGMEEPVGCAILNDCKYGHSLEGSTLRVTLIRSSYDPDPLPEIGEQEIRLAIVPHARSMSPAELTRLAAAWNHPLQAVSTGVHEGTLPADGKPAVCVKQDNVILAAVKKAEDDDALIFRLQEADGKDTLATVELNENLLGRVVSVEEVDLLERPAQTNTAGKAGNGFRVKLPAFGIASVKVELD